MMYKSNESPKHSGNCLNHSGNCRINLEITADSLKKYRCVQHLNFLTKFCQFFFALFNLFYCLIFVRLSSSSIVYMHFYSLVFLRFLLSAGRITLPSPNVIHFVTCSPSTLSLYCPYSYNSRI